MRREEACGAELKETDVCVIGAGVSGIVAVKECLEYGLSVTCYEQRSALGGLWTGADDKVSQVDENESILSDIDPGEKFLSGAQFLEFLNLYAKHFKLENHIHLLTCVIDIAKYEVAEGDYRWTVTTQQKNGAKRTFQSSRHRYVIIASGFHKEAYIPEINLKDSTPIQVVHTGHLRSTSIMDGKRVLVVGGSISAGDVAEAAIIARAKKVIWAVTRDQKRSMWMLKLTPFKNTEAWDECFSLFVYRHYPSWMMRNLISKMTVPGYRCDNSELIDFNRDRFSVQNVDIINRALKSGTLEIIPSTISSFCKERAEVVLKNGTIIQDVDLCVLATGYKTTYSFLGKNALGDTQICDLVLHRGMVPVDPALLGLMFMYTTRISGGGFCQMEAEARWLAHQIASNGLVSKEAHQRLIKNSSLNGRVFNEGKKRSAFFITDSLACDMDCEPRFLISAFLSPFPWQRRVALATSFGPWLPHLYRLRGPYAKPQLVEDIIVRCARQRRGWVFDAVVAVVDVVHFLILGGAAYGLFSCIKRTC